ncbi:MAG TPA: hypothetical protein VEM57_07715 [Candidatus Binatus sp.]|nr:hypothetical protein [Candidatus Binatus sp.]
MRAWWVPVALVPVLGLFAVCLANALAWVDRPFPGFLILENGIIVSIGRAEWANARYRSLPFARVLAVDGHPVAGGREVQAYVSGARIGKRITYTFRRGTDIFRLALRVRALGWDDFLELFAPFLGVGLLMVLVSATVVALRPDAGETRALFAVCLAIGLILITAPDAYSPYWFTPVAFLSMCAVPPAALQLALAYPQPRALLARRPMLYGLAYLPFVGLAIALLWSMPEPTLFLPLLYLVYVFMANGVLLNVGALIFGLIDGVQPRRPVVLALAGVLGSSLIAASIVATYPLLQRPISPVWTFGPLLLLPVLEGLAFVRFPTPAPPAP